VILNATTSTDPENQTLTYAWTDGGDPISQCAAYCDYSTATGQHTIQLTVTDPGGLSATQTQTVTVQ
jgi:PKD domain